MWSFYSNPVASMSSSVNFPIGCLTKWEKQKGKKKTGHQVDFAGVRSASSAWLSLLNDRCWWIVVGANRVRDKCFRSVRQADIFFLFVNVRVEINVVSNDWEIRKWELRTAVSDAASLTSSQEACRKDAVNSQQEKAGVWVQRTGHNPPC